MNLTAYHSRGVVLTDGTTTVDMRSRLVWCNGYAPLLGRAPMNGNDQALPDFDGIEAGPRSRSGLTGRLDVVVDGSWNADNSPFNDTPSAMRDHMLETLDDLYDVIATGQVLDVTVHEDRTYTGEMIVDDPDRAPLVGWRAELRLEVLLPHGRLT